MPDPEYVKDFPRKRLAAGALFLDDQRRILILEPTYREGWLVPGGVIEADESPREGCEREIWEETDLAISLERLLCVEYKSREGANGEVVQFIFYGGVLSPAQTAQIRLRTEEIASYRFLPAAEAVPLLNPRLGRRMAFALRALEEERIIYLENGVELG